MSAAAAVAARCPQRTQKGFEKAGMKMLKMVGLHHLDDAHTKRARPDGFEALHSPQMMTRDEGGACELAIAGCCCMGSVLAGARGG